LVAIFRCFNALVFSDQDLFPKVGGMGELSREADSISVKDAANFASSTSLSRQLQDSLQPLQSRSSKEAPAFLDLSMDGLYGSGIDSAAGALSAKPVAMSETGEPKLDAEAKVLRVVERRANQAVEPIPPVSDSIKNAPDASPVVLNVQITNVPEVSQGVAPQQWMHHLNAAFAAGAQAIKPIEKWMATPNAATDALAGIGPVLEKALIYYANTPGEQVASDVQAVFGKIGDALDRTFSYAHTPEDRAKTAGEIMPLIFTDGFGTAGESASLQTADAVATHVDTAVMQTIHKSLDAIKKAPDLAAEIKQGLYEFLKGQGLTAHQVEYAGIPRGWFDDIQRGAAKDDTFFAMSEAEEGNGIARRSGPGHEEGGVNCQIDRETGRLQRTDFGKVREPYNWQAINERFSPDVVRQANEDSCISAVGQMLSKGRITEQHLITELGARPELADLRRYLGDEWTSQKRSFRSFAEISDEPWGAELMENAGTDLDKSLHSVVVDGVGSDGNLLIRDPWEGAKYEMTPQQFLKIWTGRAIYRPREVR
jgi:hypothetical protein